MRDAVQELAAGHYPADPDLASLARSLYAARVINQAHRGPVISAWETEQLDERTIEFFSCLVEEMPARARMAQRQEQARLAWLSNHPTYGKMGLLSRNRES